MSFDFDTLKAQLKRRDEPLTKSRCRYKAQLESVFHKHKSSCVEVESPPSSLKPSSLDDIDMPTPDGQSISLGGPAGFLPHLVGLSGLGSLALQPYLYDSLKVFTIGSLAEGMRRMFSWLTERFKFRYSISAQFDRGDNAHEWIVLFLTQQKVWNKSRHFRVTAKNSQRKWGVKLGSQINNGADYVPDFGTVQLFRWDRYWIEVSGDANQNNNHRPVPPAFPFSPPLGPSYSSNSLTLTIFTRDLSALAQLVEDARRAYTEAVSLEVIIHTMEAPGIPQRSVPIGPWQTVIRKHHRSISSLILEEGVRDSVMKDVQDFLSMESWYIEVGIPYHRGYLLYGPPGTGKTSTIYAIAGELGLEIFSLSLASTMNDSSLQQAARAIPKRSILLIEDIDCAFPSREDEDEDELILPIIKKPGVFPRPRERQTSVTLSGLLNLLDGVGSEEGSIFFATTNHPERLDSAFLRPGRIDKKVEYKLATKGQARALFHRFYPTKQEIVETHLEESNGVSSASQAMISNRSTQVDTFVEAIPENQFSVAELQGYLLMWKMQPDMAVAGITEWVEHELAEKRKKREEAGALKQKVREAKRKAREEAAHPVVVNFPDRRSG